MQQPTATPMSVSPPTRPNVLGASGSPWSMDWDEAYGDERINWSDVGGGLLLGAGILIVWLLLYWQGVRP